MFNEEARSTETYNVEKHQKKTLRVETCCVHFVLIDLLDMHDITTLLWNVVG